ncbi:MAG: exodeoxyribonuclease VII large subunit [Bacteroidales bacterium]|nr:exodeoxyribonuclease VII large subunit [Bacteroidales bacterium]MDD2323172.1 exodeoxyribonuclease VII large subunit [Bacteroidales bacterium]MDD3010319.1 exodeoxyribonuclease VII large subunit [Bacteroidales bacterium]MDD3961206.1 exodeoxyribonuclease VII large subunit [Bacteroidales bacterium]MDY0284630.1 exodeoxyribonuclease VII large subunit [Bacteroidales bacterium]
MRQPEYRKIIELSDLTDSVQQVLQDYFRRPVWIKAEISEWKAARNGHYYLQLVEKQYGIIQAQMRAMIWSGAAKQIIPYFENKTKTSLNKGITILFLGIITYHPVYGLAIQIEDIDPEYTLGEMAREKAETIAILQREGLWDRNRELVVPMGAQRLAIIAAPGSKGLSDFQKTLKTLCPRVRFTLTLFASLMQGDRASSDIIRNLEQIEKEQTKYDAIVLIRGGGAELDLKCFDELSLCKSLANSSLPVITGIGHADDETLCDRIASVWRKTPTDTAVFICESINQLLFRIEKAEQQIATFTNALIGRSKQQLYRMEHHVIRTVHNEIRFHRNRLTAMSEKITTSSRYSVRSAHRDLEEKAKQVSQYATRMMQSQSKKLEHALQTVHWRAFEILKQAGQRLETAQKMLSVLHPEQVLRRGYSITRLNGKAITSNNQLTPGDEVTTLLYKGKFTSIINKINPHDEKKYNL